VKLDGAASRRDIARPAFFVSAAPGDSRSGSKRSQRVLRSWPLCADGTSQPVRRKVSIRRAPPRRARFSPRNWLILWL